MLSSDAHIQTQESGRYLQTFISAVGALCLTYMYPVYFQAVKNATPIKSGVYLLGMSVAQYELTKFGREGISASGAGLTPLVVAGACYLIITVPLGLLARHFEKRAGARSRK